MEEVLTGPEYANLELVDTVYGNDVAEDSVTQALALVDSHPDLELIMAPTTVGIVAAAQAMTSEGLCDQVKVSGLGLPEEMAEYTLSGCAPEFALWSFVDLGYLAYYVAYGSPPSRSRPPRRHQAFVAGRMGEYTIDDRSGARCRAPGAHGPVHRVQRRATWRDGGLPARASGPGSGRPNVEINAA